MATDKEKKTPSLALSPEERARADVYALLGNLLATPPNQKLLDLLRDIHCDETTDQGIMTAAWQALSTAAQNAEQGTLDDEYQQLFIGVGRGELLPYASWYLTGFLMDKPLANLRTDLARLGYTLKVDVSEPEDHVAALCETMAAIISEMRSSFEAQKAFHNKHIAPWMERFFNDLAQASTARFYKAVGELGRQFMELEKQYYSMPH